MRGRPAAREVYGADVAAPLSELEERLPTLLRGREAIYYPLGGGPEPVEMIVRQVFERARATRQRRGTGPRRLSDPGVVLDDLRLVKDPHELALIREAALITAEGLIEAAPLIAPGVGEWEVEAALESAFRRRGAEGVGFGTIVASGANATVLHYIDNRRRMAAGELVVIDAGALPQLQRRHLAHLPVSGRFSSLRGSYDAVLEAHDRAIGRFGRYHAGGRAPGRARVWSRP